MELLFCTNNLELLHSIRRLRFTPKKYRTGSPSRSTIYVPGVVSQGTNRAQIFVSSTVTFLRSIGQLCTVGTN